MLSVGRFGDNGEILVVLSTAIGYIGSSLYKSTNPSRVGPRTSTFSAQHPILRFQVQSEQCKSLCLFSILASGVPLFELHLGLHRFLCFFVNCNRFCTRPCKWTFSIRIPQ